MLIIGTIIGSGFASGKEIAVYFSRFGVLSYLFILLASLMFFAVFYFILINGERGIQRVESSKFFLILSVVINLVFTSSMMAGTIKTMRSHNVAIDILLILLLILACVYISQNGISFLSKINSFLIPFTLMSLIFCLINNIGFSHSFSFEDFYSGFFFSVLYVILNTALSSLVVGKLGKGTTKKEKLMICGCACAIIFVFLVFINYVILSNPNTVELEMPLLEISKNGAYYLMRFVVFFGCLTTLFSLVFTVSKCLEKLNVHGIINLLISIVLPFSLSFVGFDFIVSFLYPLCSILGILILFLFLPIKIKLKKKKKKTTNNQIDF